MVATTPKKIDAVIRSFCSQVCPKHEPLFVPVIPAEGALPSECFPNVRAKIAEEGGAIVHGWQVWVWPSVFIEAEHHAIWQASNGALIDVTPKMGKETRILFVRDDDAIDDDITYKRLDNKRRALTKDPTVNEWIDLSEKFVSVLEENSVGREIRLGGTALDSIECIEQRRLFLFQQIVRRYIRPNDRCPCASGKKFKHCCGTNQR